MCGELGLAALDFGANVLLDVGGIFALSFSSCASQRCESFDSRFALRQIF